MDVDWGYVYLKQHLCESTYEYCERFKYYLDKYPTPCINFQVHLMNFLDGMLPDERYILDDMAGRWIMDCTPSEVWYLIEERAERTRPCSPDLVQAFFEFDRQLVEINEMLERMDEKMERYAKDMPELISAPAPTQVSLDDKKVTALTEEQADEDIMEEEFGVDEDIMEEEFGVDEDIMEEEFGVDEEIVEEEMLVVPIMSTADVPTECISPQCSDRIIEQNMVIAFNPIIPLIFELALSRYTQNDTIKEALRNNQVWGLLETVRVHIPMVRAPNRMLKSEKFLDSLCANWKTRKKDMQGSLDKNFLHSQMARAPKQTQKLEKLPNGLHKIWRRRKKGKRIFVNNKALLFFVQSQRSHSTFG